MTPDTTIRSISVRTLDIPLWESFGIAGGTQDLACNLLVVLELADGTIGYGEAAPLPMFNGETQEQARHVLETAQAELVGRDAQEQKPLIELIYEHTGNIYSARCALETAVLDALARRSGTPFWKLFGSQPSPLETDMTITTQADLGLPEAVEHARESARNILNRGIHAIKMKIGSGDIALDYARVAAVHAESPSSPIILDGNQGLSVTSALELLEMLQQAGIRPALFEQPVRRDDLAGVAAVTKEGGVPVAADESASDLAAVQRIAELKAANVINIKLMKTGIAEALRIVAFCRANGLELMIGGMVESILGGTVSACFAAGLGCFKYIDLDTPLFMSENPFQGGVRYHGAQMDLSEIVAGHGVQPAG